MLSRLDIKIQTLAMKPRSEIWGLVQQSVHSLNGNGRPFYLYLLNLSSAIWWGAANIPFNERMKCYMLFGLCGRATHKIISQSIILFQTTNVFLGLGLRPPGPISSFAISIWDLPFRLFIFWQLKVRLPMLPMRWYNLPLVKIRALAPSNLLSCAQSKILIIFDIRTNPSKDCTAKLHFDEEGCAENYNSKP